MVTLAQIRAALAEQLSNELPSTVNVHASPVDNIYDTAVVVMGFPHTVETFGGGSDVDVTLVAAVPRVADKVTELDDLVDAEGSESIHAAIAADRTLGGTVADAMVVGVEDYEVAESGGGHYYTATVKVRVMR